MKFSTVLIGIAGFLASTVQAGVFTNQPFDKVTWAGGSTQSIVWKDDGKAPPLKDINNMKIELMAGNQDNQFPVAVIAKSVKGTTLKVTYTVPKTVGPSGNFYFIKYTAGDYIAFSGTFSIEGVNGNIPNFDPKNPGVPLTATTTTTSRASTKTNKSDPTNTTNDSPTSASEKTGGNSGSTPSAAPQAGSCSTIHPSSRMASLSLAIVLLAVSYLY